MTPSFQVRPQHLPLMAPGSLSPVPELPYNRNVPQDFADFNRAAANVQGNMLASVLAAPGHALDYRLPGTENAIIGIMPDITRLGPGVLSRFGKHMYREVSPDKVETFLPLGTRYDDIRGGMYMANAKDLALGQGQNRGALLTFDASKLRGSLSKKKPGWELSAKKGQGEFMTAPNLRQQDYQDALVAVRMLENAATDPITKRRLEVALKQLEAGVWRIKDGEYWR